MKVRNLGIPSISMLVAFESAARLGGVKRAAEDLDLAPSAVSRNISRLEVALDVQLYERSGRNMTLTAVGKSYLSEVQVALHTLCSAGAMLHAGKTTLTMACSQELSIMALRPIYSLLQRSLGEHGELRVLNCDYDMMAEMWSTDIIISFEQTGTHPYKYAERILEEEIVPVICPDLLRHFGSRLAAHPREWSGIPRLSHVVRGDRWATWSWWFRSYECEPPEAVVREFDSYFDLVEAAADGEGVALGWNGYVNSYLESGRLVAVRDEWQRTQTGLYALLTRRGSRKPSAMKFLRKLSCLMKDVTSRNKVLRAWGQ